MSLNQEPDDALDLEILDSPAWDPSSSYQEDMMELELYFPDLPARNPTSLHHDDTDELNLATDNLDVANTTIPEEATVLDYDASGNWLWKRILGLAINNAEIVTMMLSEEI